MNQQGPILVALDGSELAEGAIPYANAIARAERTHLALVTVWEAPGSSIEPGLAMEMERNAREHLSAYLNALRDRLCEPQSATHVRTGDGVEEIIAAATETGARLIAIASHGRSGIGRWLLGSTAGRLLRESPVPLLVVGPEALKASPGEVHIRRVMVPLDGSERSDTALEPGCRLASEFDATLYLVRSVPWASVMYLYPTMGINLGELDVAMEEGAREYLQHQMKRCPPSVKTEIAVVRGAPADALIEFEEQQRIDLTVMTTHARRGLARAALGSTAERLMHGRAPVLLLRPDVAS